MLLTAGIVAILSVVPADFSAANQTLFEVPHLTTNAGVRVSHRLALNSPLLDAADMDAQRRRRHSTTNPTTTDSNSAPADNSTSTPADSEHPAGSGDSTAAAPAADTPSQPAATSTPAADASANASAPAEEEPSVDLMRHREHLVRMHRPLGLATWASLLITEIAGTILAVNQRTVFGVGACNIPTNDGSNPCLLGDFGGGRGPLNAFHELSAFITVGFYAATGLYAMAMPDPEHASVGSDSRASRLRVHKALAWVHMLGMVLLPILGVLSVEPGLVGLNIDTTNSMTLTSSRARIDNYQSDMRTVHLAVGYVTFAALTIAMLYEVAF